MKVSTQQDFQIIYSVFQHEYLGYLFESFVVQKDEMGNLSLLSQNISSKNATEFKSGLDKTDFELIELMDAMQQDVVIQRFAKKKMKPADFFEKYFDQEKGNKPIQEAIETFLETKRRQILDRIQGKYLYEMGKDGNPAWKRIEVLTEKATILFHFWKNADNTHYYPSIKYKGEKIELANRNGYLICHLPAWLVLDSKLFHFDGKVDGPKLKPFLRKKFILIPSSVEDTYYRKFVAPLVEQFDVLAHGIRIEKINEDPTPILEFSETGKAVQSNLFESKSSEGSSAEIVFNLKFQYGTEFFHLSPFRASSVNVKSEEGKYTFVKYVRNNKLERLYETELANLGAGLYKGVGRKDFREAFDWLNNYSLQLQQLGFRIIQHAENAKKYFTGYTKLDLEIDEGIDWFDIRAIVSFGEFEIPFKQIRKLMLRNERELTLPNGQVAIIPDSWFVKYADLIQFSHEDSQSTKLHLRKHHLGLLHKLQEGELAKISIGRKLEKLMHADFAFEYDMPVNFKGELRPYQKAGYDWLNFLHEFRFGGCLADDMGLGKTVQTLALLLKQKESGKNQPSLLIMPTSLIYNWQLEAEKFVPTLQVLNYTGSSRKKDAGSFDDYDLIITSYGIIRQDIEFLQTVPFNYIILDESQAIKNPGSQISQAVRQLKSLQRLVLTGTPVENSTMDLWSQISFVNPGLLGNQQYFKDHYQIPIENKADAEKTQKLHALIKPFVLRRKKSQVARDLPDKVMNIQYCEMSPEQAERYEEVKAAYRESILNSIQNKGLGGSQFMILEGLTKLRQLANHPKMIDPSYQGNSGKLEDVIYKLEHTVSEGHKVLVFSQFVKHLQILKDYFDAEGIKYAYLDGAVKDRQSAVENFRENDDVPIFLISLKAGGLGLNLTMADYVFLLDPWWNPAIEAQAIDRAHRIGQKNTVFSYKFISRNTVEEKILLLQERKLKLANDLISTEDSFIKSLSPGDILSLLS
jgi:superfamily II DNA or RNA helicase